MKNNIVATHPSTNVANCCLTSIVVTLAFYHSAIGKRQISSGDLSALSCISQCILMQPFARQTLHVIGKEFHLVSNLTVLTHWHIWHILHYTVIDWIPTINILCAIFVHCDIYINIVWVLQVWKEFLANTILQIYSLLGSSCPP